MSLAPLLLVLQVTGTVRYQDRVYDAGGFTGATPFRPVRQAEVEIVNNATQTVVGNGTTDDLGDFSIGGVPDGLTVYARVYARRADGGIHAEVRNNTAADAVYAATTQTALTAGGGNAAIPTRDLTIAEGAAPAFNIFDCAVKSFQYQDSVDPDLPAVPARLLLYWEADTPLGTFFSEGPNAVFLLGIASDPDQYDDDIILHEIGHWVASNFSKDDTLGGPHSITDQLDPRTSWSEGWSHYWSAAVRRFFPGEYPAPEVQVDNFGAGNSAFELETPSFPAETVMATNEGAVAAVLWDVADPANEAFDLVSGAEAEVWLAFNDRIPLRSLITLEDFREGLALEAPGIMPDVTGSAADLRIMNDRLIRYHPDVGESDDTPGTAVPLAPDTPLAQRTTFGIGDEDWYAVDVPAGRVLSARAFNPGDGARPRLEIFDPSGATLLASGTFSATLPVGTAGTYLVRVTAAGPVVENGYYDIEASVFSVSVHPKEAGYCSASAAVLPGASWVPVLLLLGILACSARR